MPVDKFGRMSDAKTKDTGVSLSYINNNYASKVYVEEAIERERKHLIVVTAYYYGYLIKDKYQVTFNTPAVDQSIRGFIIPYSGRIKKIVSKVNGLINLRNLGSIFSLSLTKKGESIQTRLTDYRVKVDKVVLEKYFNKGYIDSADNYKLDYHFDNDLNNCPLSEGDHIYFKTIKHYSYDEYNWVVDREEFGDPTPRFLFTFLIELDPL